MKITTEQALEYIAGVMAVYDIQPRQRITALVRAIKRFDNYDDAAAENKEPDRIDEFLDDFAPESTRGSAVSAESTEQVAVQLYRMEESRDRGRAGYHFLEDFPLDEDIEYVKKKYGPGVYALRKCVGGKWRKQVTFDIAR